MLNQLFQRTEDLDVNVAENTKLGKILGVHPVYPWASRQIGKIIKNNLTTQPKHLFELICCQRYLQNCSLRYVYLAPNLTHNIKFYN